MDVYDFVLIGTSNIPVLTHGYSDCLLFKRVWFSF